MGGGIAQVMALSGHSVALADVDAAIARLARERLIAQTRAYEAPRPSRRFAGIKVETLQRISRHAAVERDHWRQHLGHPAWQGDWCRERETIEGRSALIASYYC